MLVPSSAMPPPNPQKVKLFLDPSTGQILGSFIAGSTGKLYPLRPELFEKQSVDAGNFGFGSTSGAVNLDFAA